MPAARRHALKRIARSPLEALVSLAVAVSPKTLMAPLARHGARLSPEKRYRLAEQVSSAIDPSTMFSERGRIFLDDDGFRAKYRRFMDPDNWRSYDRKYFLDQLLPLAMAAEGDLVECGCYRGASAYLMCLAARAKHRRVHLFDSFEGLSEPDAVDGEYWSAGALAVDEDSLRAALSEFDHFETYKGWIPDRFEDVAGLRFCFAHIDVDLYEPTRDAIAFFYPRMSPGGVMLFDDYGFSTCPGAKRAVDEHFAGTPEPVISAPTGQAFVVKR